MDIQATHEELMLRDATRAFLESRAPLTRVRELASTPSGFDPKLWEDAASLGWFAMLVPEAHGGAGIGADGVVAATILAEELGRMLHPGPFVGVNVVADAVTRVGSGPQQEAVLPSLVDGTAVATCAIADGSGRWDARCVPTSASRPGDGYVLSGTKHWVQDGQNAADVLVTCRRDDGCVVQLLVPTDAAGVTVTPLETMDLGRRLADIEFADVAVEPDAILGDPAGAAAEAARQLRLAVVLQCAETVGVTASILERTVDYAKDRIAFGRPIGSFQAVKHHLADAVTSLEAAQAATWAAVRSVAADAADVIRAVHIAKVFVGRRCPHIVEVCMQVCGGIAMTWEDDSHLFLRRVQSNRMLFGTPAWHADRLCDIVGMVV
jgi:alkylation response protein AidB-like acyl-CoA dehydrogenase